MAYSDAELERAVEALSDPERFREAETRLSPVAPQLQRILGEALHAGGWVGEAEEEQVRKALASPNAVAALRALLAEEARLAMLVGVAVGWELSSELRSARSDSDRED